MAEYINRDAAIAYLEKHKIQGMQTLTVLRVNEDGIIKFLKEKCPAVDVVPMAEVEALQDCIYDLYEMLEKIIDNAKHHDLAALRPHRGASGCDAYQGAPPICRKFDEVFDKHVESIYAAIKFAELKKKYTEGE